MYVYARLCAHPWWQREQPRLNRLVASCIIKKSATSGWQERGSSPSPIRDISQQECPVCIDGERLREDLNLTSRALAERG